MNPPVLAALALFAAAPRPDAGVPLKARALARPVQVSADRLDILGREDKAIYSGHARAVRDETTITCDRLVVSYSKRQEVDRIDAEGSVVVTDGDRRATGERAGFDNATGVLTLTGNPQAFQGGSHVQGTQVVFTTGTDVIDIDDARTLMEDGASPGGKQPVAIDADHLRIFGQERQAVWTGKVTARRGSTRMSGAKLTASYGPDQQLTHLRAQGNAEARDGERWARGDRADYDPKTGVLVVTGNPQARQGENWLAGTRVTFTTGNDKLEVDNPRSILHPEPKR